MHDETGKLDKQHGLGAGELMQIIVLTREFTSLAEGLYYIDAPALDLVEAGRTPEQAHDVFMSALQYLVEGWLERGTLHSRLLELGYVEEVRDLQQPGEQQFITFCPPALSDTRQLDEQPFVAREPVSYKALSYSFRRPLINAS